MTGLGVDGIDVDLASENQIVIEKRQSAPGDRKAIIYSDLSVLEKITVNIDGYEVHSVKEAKGLEFETVLVLPNNMTDHEMYIAYTRALNRLFLIDI